jgi:hypothetical protein
MPSLPEYPRRCPDCGRLFTVRTFHPEQYVIMFCIEYDCHWWVGDIRFIDVVERAKDKAPKKVHICTKEKYGRS